MPKYESTTFGLDSLDAATDQLGEFEVSEIELIRREFVALQNAFYSDFLICVRSYSCGDMRSIRQKLRGGIYLVYRV